jgi:flagellar biosynthesis chaperone FliJ
LEVSQQHERNAQVEVARAQAAEDLARERCRSAMDVWKEWEIRVRERQKGTLDPRRLNEMLLSLDIAQKRAFTERKGLEKAEWATEQARAQLRRIAVERRSYEKLRERKHEEHTVAAVAHETRGFDDMASVRFAGRRGQESSDSFTGVQQ